MTIASSALGNMMKERMNWTVQRQTVLAENIANANTPEYVAKDLKALNFKQSLGAKAPKVAMRTTHEAHLVSPYAAGDRFDVEKRKTGYEISPDGNRVVLEEQMMKLNRTNGMHNMTTNLMKKYNMLYRMALKGQ